MEDCISKKRPGDVLVMGIDTNAALGVRTKEDGDNYIARADMGFIGFHRANVLQAEGAAALLLCSVTAC
jgi:hypothetical protein